MSDCPISAFLVLGIAKDAPAPEGVAGLATLVVSTKLRCSMTAGHPGNRHQAYHRDRLHTWVFPDPRDADAMVGVGDIGRVEGS